MSKFLTHLKAVRRVAVSQNRSYAMVSATRNVFLHGIGQNIARARINAGPERTLRRGIAPHGVLRPGERRLLLRRHADRLGAYFPRQQSLALFSPARGSALHPAARPHSALVGLRTRRRQRSFSGDPAGALAAVVRINLRGVRRCEMRLGSGGDSHPDQVSPQGDHAS